MTEEKKPKIDLKARLGKKDTGAMPAAAPSEAGLFAPSASVTPPPIASHSVASLPPGIPVPPGMAPPSGPSLDPSNPLVAATAQRPSAPQAAPGYASAGASRIEVDDMAIQQATSSAKKTGFVIAGIASVLFAGVGYVAGGASEQGASRKKSHEDAVELKADIAKAKTQLEQLHAKLEAGKAMLAAKDAKARKFPDTLDGDLGAIIVDFDGAKLAGRRFSGYSQDVSKSLFDFVAHVSALNDHKTALKNLLSKLKKPLTDQLAANASGTHAISHIVLLGGPTGRDGKDGNFVGTLGVLSPPITFTGDTPTFPKDEFAVVVGGRNTTVPRYKAGTLAEPSAVYVTPSSFEAACPSDTKSQSAQLSFKLGDLITEIKGEEQAEGMTNDQKAGLIDQADKLMKALEKI